MSSVESSKFAVHGRRYVNTSLSERSSDPSGDASARRSTQVEALVTHHGRIEARHRTRPDLSCESILLTAASPRTRTRETMPIGIIIFAKTVRNSRMVEERRSINCKRRVEAPTKWVVEDSASGQKRVDAEPRIPIPTEAHPAWAIQSRPGTHVGMRGTHARFR